MNSINVIVWLFPVIFMIHDFEEIILVSPWKKKYKNYLDTCTIKKKPFEDFKSTDSFSIGVEILFLIFSFASLFSIIFNSYYIWYGLFFATAAHFITAHLNLTIKFKHYVPGIITAILFLPLSIYILYTATLILAFSVTEVILSCVAGSLFGFVIYVFLHSIEKNFENLLVKFSNK
ncbi:HXXEE domain-containing protein [Clostridium botulinum]|nr:HXXEE domain-containing protein [Clostridium botulinum]NFS54560.1 HXXEE domain-containing protein [Clostridium botulinum]NFT17530.1 HXXEE domain-containing protein [Clostridium botulinum]